MACYVNLPQWTTFTPGQWQEANGVRHMLKTVINFQTRVAIYFPFKTGRGKRHIVVALNIVVVLKLHSWTIGRKLMESCGPAKPLQEVLPRLHAKL